MAKPNFRWFGSGRNVIVFDVDDVKKVRIWQDCWSPPEINIHFWHQEMIIFYFDSNHRELWDELYAWVKYELVAKSTIEIEEER